MEEPTIDVELQVSAFGYSWSFDLLSKQHTEHRNYLNIPKTRSWNWNVQALLYCNYLYTASCVWLGVVEQAPTVGCPAGEEARRAMCARFVCIFSVGCWRTNTETNSFSCTSRRKVLRISRPTWSKAWKAWVGPGSKQNGPTTHNKHTSAKFCTQKLQFTLPLVPPSVAAHVMHIWEYSFGNVQNLFRILNVTWMQVLHVFQCSPCLSRRIAFYHDSRSNPKRSI